MKFVKVAIAGSLLAFVMTVSAQAQNLRASIPFRFNAGDQVLPAGDYTLKVDLMHQRLEVYGDNGAVQCFLPLMAQSRLDTQGKAALVFNSYGRAHFLKALKGPGQVDGWDLFVSRAEREMAKTEIKTSTVVALAR